MIWCSKENLFMSDLKKQRTVGNRVRETLEGQELKMLELRDKDGMCSPPRSRGGTRPISSSYAYRQVLPPVSQHSLFFLKIDFVFSHQICFFFQESKPTCLVAHIYILEGGKNGVIFWQNSDPVQSMCCFFLFFFFIKQNIVYILVEGQY